MANEIKSEAQSDPCSQPTHSKQKLLRAAFEVFSSKGFHGATTKLIAQTAGVNEALIMRHFKSKEGLFIAVIDENLAGKTQNLDYPAQATLEAELIKFADYIFDRDRQQKDFLRIVIGHSLQEGNFACRAHEQFSDRRESVLTERLRQLRAKGEVGDTFKPEQIEEMVKGQVFSSSFFMNLICVDSESDAREDLHTAIRAIARGVR